MALPERQLPRAVGGGVNMVMDFGALRQRLEELRQFVKEYMVPGEDYGIIGDSKPTLFKPGAEKLCDVYGLSAGEAHIEFTRDDTKNPIYISYRVSLPLISRTDGKIIMVGVGSANSWEKKYRWRWVTERDLPPDLSKDNLKQATFDGRYGSYIKYRIPNDEIDDLDNTLLKMAKKRALIDAVLSATRSSALFTQDIEDLEEMTVRQPESVDRRQRTQPDRSNGSPDISQAQKNLILRKAQERGMDTEELNAFVYQATGKSELDMLTKQEASKLIDLLAPAKTR
ncbi:hypothetical protein SAMN04489725_12516 [Alicyclobacillus hesperidum]|uniref:Uncharacterized protein n=1 Tax=Alicyclobacillus hesperidum TaxID=89784 RepID=A0A1H2XX19_9BACL|nr:hypothetical protein [Alicyclobacillus hesperidum]SDW97502.1 hypothetical protein SAMN04489725_12516 [Alicyclobacillus hesperidum]